MTETDLQFTHPVLTKIIGEPTAETILLLTQQVYANAKGISSTLGGGAHGHLGMLMPPAEYLALAGVAFVFPAPPPSIQPAYPPGATVAVRQAEDRAYKQHVTEYNLADKVRTAIRGLIEAAVNDLYYDVLGDRLLGVGNVEPGVILAHLVANYAEHTNSTIFNNRKSLEEDWSPDEPIEVLWKRIRVCQQIATAAGAAGSPISDADAIRATLEVLEKTGVFEDALADWEAKPQTLAELRQHFTKENRRRIKRLTTKGAGYHGANAAAGDPAPAPALTKNDIIEAFTAALAAQAAANPPTGRDGGGGNGRDARRGRGGGGRSRGGRGGGGGGHDTQRHYCHTHGVTTGPHHTGYNCENPNRDTHKPEATFEKRMGGSNYVYGQSRY